MSRTYRRKNSLIQDSSWVFIDWEWCGNHFIRKELKGKELKRAKAVYHSDAQCTMEQVPKWYKVLFCRRPFRRKQKAVLDNAKKYDYENVTMPIEKKNALYYW